MDYTFFVNNWWIGVLAVWELVWKGLALWRAAEHKQRYWFVALLFINTVGILPIVYLLFFHTGKYKLPHFLNRI